MLARQAAAAVGVRTCWPWETAATLPSTRRRKALRRPRGRRGADAYHGGRPPTACYAALLPRRGPHIALHSVCPSVRLSVRLSVRPVLVYIRTSVTCFTVFSSTLRTCGIFCFVYISGPHIVRPSRPHKLVYIVFQTSILCSFISFCTTERRPLSSGKWRIVSNDDNDDDDY